MTKSYKLIKEEFDRAMSSLHEDEYDTSELESSLKIKKLASAAIRLLKKGVEETSNHIESFRKAHRTIREWPVGDESDGRNDDRAKTAGFFDLVEKESSIPDRELRRELTAHDAQARRQGKPMFLPKFELAAASRGTMSTKLLYFNSFNNVTGKLLGMERMRPGGEEDDHPDGAMYRTLWFGARKYMVYLKKRLELYEYYLNRAKEAYAQAGGSQGVKPEQQAEPAAEPQQQSGTAPATTAAPEGVSDEDSEWAM